LFNQRLIEETIKRNSFCESRRSNIQHRYKKSTSVKHMNIHMENEDEDEDDNIKNKDIGVVLETWNNRMPWKVKKITGLRLVHLKTRLLEKEFKDNFNTILTKILVSDFLMGKRTSKGHTNFKADFDWLIKNDTNYIKIIEGKYDNREPI